MTEEQTLLEFPCSFPVKAMGRHAHDFEALVTGLVLKHASLIEGESIKLNHSGGRNFVSVTVVIEATSRSQLDLIYQDLTDCEQVLMAL